MFVLAPLEQLLRPSFRKEDFVLGKKLGEGAFGTVYKASLSNPNLLKNSGPLVVKKANEYGAVEVWMNERVRRACRNSCADFVHGFLESNPNKKGDEFWLVWRYEGKETLADLMANKDFPYNVEEVMLGMANVDDLPKGPERENRIIGRIMRQILNSLYQLHATGIVHRDIKPQNIIFSDDSKVFKIIDLGAAADLRVGINYAPKEFLLDPRYAAPEQYIMSTQTPSAPPVLVAALLSPVLWQMNFPDHFDVYSAGLIFLQMVFPNLRSDSGLITFNRQFKRRGYDIKSWRELVESKPNQDIRHGFEILDLDGGVAWELLQAMVRFEGRQRISARTALAHPYFLRAGLLGSSFMQRMRLQIIRATQQERSENVTWVSSLMAKSGTKNAGGFTEAQLEKLREKEPRQKGSIQRNALASALRVKRKVSRTIDSTISDIRKERGMKRVNWWNRWET
jgi:serine/threonine protein kinase